MQEVLERYPFLKTYLFPLAIGGFGLLFIIVGIISSIAFRPQEHVSIQDNTPQVQATSSAHIIPSKGIVIDVEGEVVRRGIYHLPTDSRVADALQAAGGLSENADRDFVEKHINLAQKLVDGYKLYIPKVGETDPSLTSSSLDTGSDGNISSEININTASADQLDSLPGIGQVTAQKIINARPYSDVSDLLTKKIVSQKVFGEIKDKISVY